MTDAPRVMGANRMPVAAEKLGLSLNTLYAYIQQGKLPKPIKIMPGGRVGIYTDEMIANIQQAAIERSKEPEPKRKRVRLQQAG